MDGQHPQVLHSLKVFTLFFLKSRLLRKNKMQRLMALAKVFLLIDYHQDWILDTCPGRHSACQK